MMGRFTAVNEQKNVYLVDSRFIDQNEVRIEFIECSTRDTRTVDIRQEMNAILGIIK